jgi:hypothetical protein
MSIVEPVYLLDRVYLKDRTLGSIISPQGGLICKTLELPWLNNQRSISCIKEGIYPVWWSAPVNADDPKTEEDESGGRHPRDYAHYIVGNVPGRSGILIHRGHTPSWSKGCITVGGRFGDFNTDAPTIEDSAAKLQWMVENMPKKWRLRIVAKSGIPYT